MFKFSAMNNKFSTIIFEVSRQELVPQNYHSLVKVGCPIITNGILIDYTHL